MEDILASIRRIIADDQLQAGRSGFGSLKRGTPPAIPAPAVPDQNSVDQVAAAERRDPFEDVLDLARMPEAAVPESLRPQPVAMVESARVTAQREVYASEPEPGLPGLQSVDSYANGHADPGPSAEPVHFTPPASEPVAQTPIPAYESEAQQTSPSRQLQSTRDSTESLMSPELSASVMSTFETLAATVVLQNNDMLDRVMHDLMRPLLKTWLDENLPSLVERLVRAEIERVARGGRG